MEIDVRTVYADLRARRAKINELLESDGAIDTRVLLRLIASIDYHQALVFAELEPEPNGPRSLVRRLLRQQTGPAILYVIAGLIGWSIAKGYLKISQVISWFLGTPPS